MSQHGLSPCLHNTDASLLGGTELNHSWCPRGTFCKTKTGRTYMLQPTQPARTLKLAVINHSVGILIPGGSGLTATTEATDLLTVNPLSSPLTS